MKTGILISGALLTALTLTGCKVEEQPIKYEISPVARSSAALKAFGSCSELETRLKESLRDEFRVRVMSHKEDMWYYYDRNIVYADKAESENAVPGAKDDSGLKEGVDYSGTNNQEAGVDEADFVKTDGHYIYVLNRGELEIMAVPSFGQLEKSSHLAIEGYPMSMLIADKGDAAKIIVFSDINSWYDQVENGPYIYFTRYSPRVKMTIININDRTRPIVEKELYLEGSMLAARLVDSTVRLVNYSWIDALGLTDWLDVDEGIYKTEPGTVAYQNYINEAINLAIERNEKIIADLTLKDFLPTLAMKNSAGKWEPFDFTAENCQNFQMSEDGVSRGINSIFTMDILGDNNSFSVDHIVADYSVVYASKNNLLLAEPAQDYWWYWNNTSLEEATNIHRFDISDKNKTVYSGSARIPGTIENQFSLSEYEGVVRAAVTTGNWNRWWLKDTIVQDNRVYTLGGSADNFGVLGHVDGIAQGERIYSARFSGDKGFLVTFRNTDPLWTIDMSDAANPKVVGELKVPGVSTYIHPIDGDSYLLTVGYGGDNDGLNWQPQVTLFDVRDFAHPAKVDSFTVGGEYGDDNWSWSYSEALYEHKAFNYWGPMNMLAIPMSTDKHWFDERSGLYHWEALSVLELLDVDVAEGLKLHGAVDHSAFYTNMEEYPYWGYEIRRSIFMGEYVYAISPEGITCHKINNLELTSRVAF